MIANRVVNLFCLFTKDMRRVRPPIGLPPQVLKLFAAASVGITLLIALVANSAHWGASSKASPRPGQSGPIQTPTSGKARTGSTTVNGDFGAAAGVTANSGGSGALTAVPALARPATSWVPTAEPQVVKTQDGRTVIIPPAGLRPGQSYTVSMPADSPDSSAGPQPASGPISATQAQAIAEVSRQRTGSRDQSE